MTVRRAISSQRACSDLPWKKAPELRWEPWKGAKLVSHGAIANTSPKARQWEEVSVVKCQK